ncbi:cytochrome b-c1 complex subunit 1, mitochondrial-like [Sapajus apella]|uniref:Cytochrome b-c1 complex subunit 1, mitochondrial-like n=1 Tax=Sapajus apella TaxID=9515 RepID=A0A6J3HHG7_SAPAP|nr:cytochrome b-c1 complex subunit 1, mitochondrial-like [Sapajus apella]
MAASVVCRVAGTGAQVLLRTSRWPVPLRTPALRSTATFAQALQFVPETQVSKLDNGLRVASEQSSQPTCTVSWGRHWGEGLQIGPAVFSQVGV